jgi:nucleotide-binding universal stress UspA family protein
VESVRKALHFASRQKKTGITWTSGCCNNLEVTMFQNIMVGVDGSEHSFKAARVAGEVARGMGAGSMWVVVCYDPVPTYMGEPFLDDAIAARGMKAEKVLQKALDAIGPVPGAILQTQILEGPPAEAILSVAEVNASDLIIMGTRGLGRLAGLLLGSQSQKVVSHAQCPVLLVR